MGTCIGKRNARYFVLFLFYTALHCMITFTICILFVILVTVKRFPEIKQGLQSKDKTPQQDLKLQLDLVLNMLNILICVYTMCMGGFMFQFASSQHELFMQGTTTNESIRQKWNANRPKEQQIKANSKAKIRHFYWGPLPESRVEKFYQLRQKALELKAEQKLQESNQF